MYDFGSGQGALAVLIFSLEQFLFSFFVGFGYLTITKKSGLFHFFVSLCFFFGGCMRLGRLFETLKVSIGVWRFCRDLAWLSPWYPFLCSCSLVCASFLALFSLSFLRQNGALIYERIHVDKENGIYRSRKRGLFAYSLEKGYSELPANVKVDEFADAPMKEKLILDFGDAYCLYTALKTCGLDEIIRAILPGQEDTTMSIVGFKLLAGASNRYAQDWWEGSYARILFPEARLRSQRLSEYYREIGNEAIHRDFFRNYLRVFCQNNQAGVLIDSTGMPNDIRFPLTAINTHNGVTSNETRLLLVVDRHSGKPLFFRYNAGSIVDVTTLRSTIAELQAYGVRTDYAIVDAGYYSESNIRSLYGDNGEGELIPFLTRLAPNLKLYKQLVSEHACDLAQSKYMLMQRGRLLSVKRVGIDLFGHGGYAYVAIDHARREDEIYRYAKNTIDSKDVSHEDMDKAIKSKGFFILVSSEMIEAKDVMPLYYTRQAVEQIFDVSKNYTELLPLRVHSGEALRGHLLLSFIATVVYLSINEMLKDTIYNAQGAFFILKNQKCKVFDDRILPKEVNKKMNDIYKKLKIKSPIRLPFCGRN
jgi:hypothetical protein